MGGWTQDIYLHHINIIHQVKKIMDYVGWAY